MKPNRKRIQNTWPNGMFGILNHLGGVWTPRTFNSADEAQRFLERQKTLNPSWRLDKHRVVPVSVTVRARI